MGAPHPAGIAPGGHRHPGRAGTNCARAVRCLSLGSFIFILKPSRAHTQFQLLLGNFLEWFAH